MKITKCGVHPRPERHPIIQIAAIAVDESLQIHEAVEAKVKFDDSKADRRTLRKNSYHPGIWANEAHDAKVVAVGFSEFLRRHSTVGKVSARGESYCVAQLVAHNAAFDGPFLHHWYDKLSLFLPAHRLTLCTMQRAMWHFAERPDLPRPENYKLATLCQHFGVAFHAADAHDALSDVIATVGLYRALSQFKRLADVLYDCEPSGEKTLHHSFFVGVTAVYSTPTQSSPRQL